MSNLSRSSIVLSLRALSRNIGVKRAVFVEYIKPLETPLIYTPRDGVAFELLTAENLEEMLSRGLYPDSTSMALMKKVLRGYYNQQRKAIVDQTMANLDQSDICLIGFLNGELFGRVWISTQQERDDPTIERVVKWDRSTSLLYDIDIMGSIRGRGLGKALLHKALQMQIDMGYTKSQVYIENDNMASKRLATSAGFAQTRVYKCVRLFSYHRVTEDPPI